jgi:N-acetylmuramoyl-L-alanine amidase
MEIRDHLISDPAVRFAETPNVGNAMTPEYLIVHYTAGRDADSSIRHFCTPSANASAHLVIGRDGGVCQLVPFNRRAWHAGISSWAGRNGVNGFSIGIELDNAGKLVRVGNRYQAWFGARYDEGDVIQARHKAEQDMAYWHTFSEAQMSAAREIAQALVRTYSLRDILGHDDIAPGRKVDPGPAFPMRSFRSFVLGRLEDGPPPHEVNATVLNLRDGPGTGFPTIGSALPRGTSLGLLEMTADWARVAVNDGSGREGWVRNIFIAAVA